VDQYLESLNDGRQVWCLGEKVADVRTHPTISTIIRTACMDYVLPNHPDYRKLFVTLDEDGEDINFLLTSPKTPEDLLRRRECYTIGVEKTYKRRSPSAVAGWYLLWLFCVVALPGGRATPLR
jgi:aromatic ring hydroxylase